MTPINNKLSGLLRKIYRTIFWIPSRRYFRYSSLFFGLQSVFNYHPQENMLKDAFSFLISSHIDGDYLEFGVFEGWNFVSAYHLAQLFGLKGMKFFAFDSFSGLPEVTGIDAKGYRQYQTGDYYCDLVKFKKNIRIQGVDLNKTFIVPGWFKESLTETTKRNLPIKKAAIIWIDCDLYESTVPVLDFISDLVQNGTVIIFDDWFAFRGNPDRGEQRAFREWLANHPSIEAVEFLKMGWHGKSFLLTCND